MQNEETQDIYVELTDDAGQTHKLRLLAIFEAGKLNRKYGAFVTEDIILYRYMKGEFSGEVREYVYGLSDAEYEVATIAWSQMFENGYVTPEEMREGVVFMDDDTNDEEIAIAGTIISIFTVENRDYVAVCPHAIQFYRYIESEIDGQDYVEWQNILGAQEYDDVAETFNAMIEAENGNGEE